MRATLSGILIAIGFCATLWIAAPPCREAKKLAHSLERQRWLLYAVAILLATAAIWMHQLWSWPQVWAKNDDARKRIGDLALTVSGSWGSIFTVYTLAVFASAHLVLRTWISQWAEVRPEGKSQADWLKENGLSSGFSDQISQALAILGPALAGGPIAALIEALGKGST